MLSQIKKKTTAYLSVCGLLLVRAVGLEPTRTKHTPLKRACLPIPACSRTASTEMIIAPSVVFVNTFFQKNCIFSKKVVSNKYVEFSGVFLCKTYLFLLVVYYSNHINSDNTNIKNGDNIEIKKTAYHIYNNFNRLPHSCALC